MALVEFTFLELNLGIQAKFNVRREPLNIVAHGICLKENKPTFQEVTLLLGTHCLLTA